jgi:hypothetical protein
VPIVSCCLWWWGFAFFPWTCIYIFMRNENQIVPCFCLLVIRDIGSN